MSIATARSNVIFERNSFGQFAAECELAAHRTVEKTVRRGAAASRRLAPAGKEPWRYAKRAGYVPLKRSIKWEAPGTRGSWYSIAPHALHVEFGTGAHLIYGKLKFSWRKGFFYWNNKAFGPITQQGPHTVLATRARKNWNAGGAWVLHPGTNAQPFLRPAYEEVVRGQMMQIAKNEFPG